MGEAETVVDDPDDDTRGFDAIDPAYAIDAAIELTSNRALVSLALEIPAGTQAKAAVIVLRFDDGARPEPPWFCPASGVRLVDAIPDGRRLLLTLRGADCGMLPLPGAATGRIRSAARRPPSRRCVACRCARW